MSLTQKQYEALWINQRSRCALCGKKGDKGAVGRRPSLVVDHDHETQKIRGLLCGGCNVALGYIEKVSVEWLEKAMIYLRV